MDQAAGRAGFDALLRRWRRHRKLSQMALALQAEVSARHLSWLESGKAQPSRAMVLRLAQRLDLPLRERNGMLVAAGFAPLYSQREPTDLGAAQQALQRLLDAHEPWPALVVDRHWNLVAHNRSVPRLMQLADPSLLTETPLNVLRVSLHPQGLSRLVANLPRWRAHVFQRLQRQIAATGDPVLVRLLAELQAMPGGSEEAAADELVASLCLTTPLGPVHFITTLTVFGAPHDVTLSELAMETLLPADSASAERFQALMAA
jgi:transcriptional regulator with XRE-family HTH domain